MVSARIPPGCLVGLILSLTPAILQAEDPPGRVARISYVSGSVSFKPGPVDDWGQATLNYPLTSGDQIWTDREARAELRDGRTTLQVGPDTLFTIHWLDDHVTLLGLTQGTVFLRVTKLSIDDAFEITTPNDAVTLFKAGTYRIDVDSSGKETRIIVRGGEAEVTAGGASFTVEALQEAKVSGSQESSTYDIVDAPLADDFDRWCRDRNQRDKNSVSAQHVAREVIGYEDLDEGGSWAETSEYGWVWQPTTVIAGWAPYRYGRWAWIEPWGWTWIDDAPWGFAPFHYGRWAWWSGAWVWVPGIGVARPVYAPALVAFVGGGAWTASISFGVAAVAWFPLAPGEPFIPIYGVSPAYLRSVNVNVTNVNIANATYVNRAVPGAVTAVSRETVVSASPVAPSAVVLPARAVAAVPVSGSAPALAPRVESVRGLVSSTAAQVAHPPAAVLSRPTVAKMAPPLAPVPFSARQAALTAHPGKPVDSATLISLRRSSVLQSRSALISATKTSTGALKPAREGLAETHAARPSAVSAGTPHHSAVASTAKPPARPARPMAKPPAKGAKPPKPKPKHQ